VGVDGGSTLYDWKYLNGSQSAPSTGVSSAVVALTMPMTPGTYTVGLYFNNVLLANSAAITVVAAASPTVIASAATVTPGNTVTATATNGPAQPRDWIGLFKVGDPTILDWCYLNGTQLVPAAGLNSATMPFMMPSAQGNYLLRFYTGNTLLATSQTIAVTTPSSPTLTVSITTVAPGAAVSATVANGPAGRTDWIAIYPENASTYVSWVYLNGTQTAPASGLSNAVVVLPMPTTPGSYTLRLYTGATLVATSGSVSVSTGSSIALSGTMVAPGSTVSAVVSNGPGNPTDWVALYAADSPAYLTWKYLNASSVSPPASGMTAATVPFTMPLVTGVYVVRWFTGSSLLATSAPITVAFTTTLTVNTTTFAPGESVTATIGNGPGGARDWVGLYAAGGSSLLDWRYLNGSQTPSLQGATNAVVGIPMPTPPGSYTLRVATGSLILATSPLLVVQ
jgi:hypothetical protein